MGVRQFGSSWKDIPLPSPRRTDEIPTYDLAERHFQAITGNHIRHGDSWNKRNGTPTLSAALNALDGKVIAKTTPRPRHRNRLKLFKWIQRQVSKDKKICANCEHHVF